MTSNPKKVACIGGGTGLSTLLRGLKRYYTPTAIVTMADSGGHSGQLRDELGILPPGDVRACLVSLVDDEKETVMRDLFHYRFQNGSYTGASVGNLLLAALADLHGGFGPAVALAHDILRLNGRVVPVTLDPTDLLAELEDGTILFGEKTIDLPKQQKGLKVKRVWLQPKVPVNPEAAAALKEADVIVLGPGDLYTSILPNLYVDGVAEAIAASRARIIYIANIMTKYSETHGFTVETFVTILNQILPRPIDWVVYNSQAVPTQLVDRYKEEQAYPIASGAVQANWVGRAVLSTEGDLARHDSHKLAEAVHEVIERELYA